MPIRELTSSEKNLARQAWPMMDVDRLRASDEATDRYNCLAWTLGLSDRWVWPWGKRDATKKEFDQLYTAHGFPPALRGHISGFGAGQSAMKHGAISGPNHGPRWESKCGAWLRIQHGLGEMERGMYGRVVGYYAKRESLVSPTEEPRSQLELPEQMSSPLTTEERELLQHQVSRVPTELRERFAELYAAWENTWDEPLVAMSSNPADRARSREFFELIALGPDVLPLLMNEISDSDKFFALQAVDYLARRDVLVEFDLEDSAVLEGEQARAAETVRRWLGFEA